MKSIIYRLMIVILILTIGGFLGYLFTTRNGSSLRVKEFQTQSGIGGGPPAISPTTEPIINDEQTTIFLTPMTGVVQGGITTLHEEQGRVKVTIAVAAIPGITTPQPAYIQTGTCEKKGETIYTLNDVDEGRSETFINTSLDLMKAQKPLAIIIYRSDQEMNVYTSCGEIE
jgi:hypothetical protein